MSRGVPRFDWRRAILRCADEVMCALYAAEARKDNPPMAESERRLAEANAEHAAWLARSYGYRYRSPKFRRREAATA